jgi:hypothetical protein
MLVDLSGHFDPGATLLGHPGHDVGCRVRVGLRYCKKKHRTHRTTRSLLILCVAHLESYGSRGATRRKEYILPLDSLFVDLTLSIQEM